MPQPQVLISYICVVVFAATSLITLLGMINKISIEKRFLNRLFIALVLEIVAIGVLGFRNSFTPVDNVWRVRAKLQYVDKNNRLLPNQHQMVSEFTDIKQLSPLIIITQTADLVEFYVIGKDANEEDVNIAFIPLISGTDFQGSYSPKTIKLSDYKDSANVKIDEAKKYINLGTITFSESETDYQPGDSSNRSLKPSSYGPPIHR